MKTDLDSAVAALKAGGLVLMPTETVYGLAADARNAQAVQAVYTAKGRPSYNPLIVHVTGLDAARRVAQVDDQAELLMQRFWPGPLTLVLPLLDRGVVSDWALAGLDSIAVRAPAHPQARRLLAAFDGPVVAPSANRSGRPSPTTFEAAVDELGPHVAAGLDGGPCEVGLESTVLALLDQPRLLRPGAVTRAEVEAVIGSLAEADDDAKRSPGRLARHYAPDLPVRLDVETPGPDEAFLAFGPAAHQRLFQLSEGRVLAEAAANLFAHLRAADRSGARGIAVAPIPHDGLGEAINDRLTRAAGFVG